MKLLKINLDDGKPYTFQTFTVMEQIVMKKVYEDFQDTQDDSLKIQFETDENKKLKRNAAGDLIPRLDLTVDEKKSLRDIEDKMLDFSVDIVVKSICKNHKEFIKTGDAVADKAANDKLQSLIDAPMLKKLVSFAFTGTYQPDGEEIMDFTVSVNEVK
jgi:uncharacterized protein YaaW (UPF0174 family)